MILKIVQAGEPVLRSAARALTAEEVRSPSVQNLIELMRETMRDAPGVGLAAPQIGLPLQLAVIEDRAELLAQMRPEVLAERERRPVPFHVIVNPAIALGEEFAEFYEGCLSVTGFSAIVPRARTVHVDCMDQNGAPQSIDAQGWYARILQHEIDHLQGTLYTDRMLARSLTTGANLTRYWERKDIEAVKRELGMR